ncbi:hypothetical protein J4573_40590 [Actinomadura barringtoniae]|uniref:Uncharacterized protein n=1 Tax=Actinomadura barringtoniae TaxID=1427535 RepID=A0A939PJT2_9ACTN|nr:hypothetical protein [Actinomadura barringtoniae]MBO2453448.1 hypothetical protein [Actinomadura barringtoniae]
MGKIEAPSAQAPYIGCTTEELRARRTGDRIAAGVDQSVLFQRRGEASLHDDRLVLQGWGDGGDLVLRPDEVTSVANEYTKLYGRFIGGLLNAGKPLILGTVPVGEIYLMIDHRTFMETTDNRKWSGLIREWLGDGA